MVLLLVDIVCIFWVFWSKEFVCEKDKTVIWDLGPFSVSCMFAVLSNQWADTVNDGVISLLMFGIINICKILFSKEIDGAHALVQRSI